MRDMVRLFVGYDPDEALAYSVFSYSVQRCATHPVQIAPIALSQLTPRIFDRPREARQSTDFAFTRFLVPYLCGYEGWALFMDGDMLCRRDLYDLWALRDPRYAVQVVRHEQKPAPGSKFLGRENAAYERKNWSSVMLFNNARCKALTPDYVNGAAGLDLHRFHWLPADALDVGALPAEWNHLVGVDEPRKDAGIVHYTLGMPFFTGYNECEYSREWRAMKDLVLAYSGYRATKESER